MKSSPFSLFVVLFAFAIGATPARAQRAPPRSQAS